MCPVLTRGLGLLMLLMLLLLLAAPCCCLLLLAAAACCCLPLIADQLVPGSNLGVPCLTRSLSVPLDNPEVVIRCSTSTNLVDTN